MTQQSRARGKATIASCKRAILLGLVLLAAGTPAAADEYREPGQRPGGPPPPMAAYPLLLPPCTDWIWPILLRCTPRASIVVPIDDVYLQNQIRAIPPTRRPYPQVFKW